MEGGREMNDRLEKVEFYYSPMYVVITLPFFKFLTFLHFFFEFSQVKHVNLVVQIKLCAGKFENWMGEFISGSQKTSLF